MDIRVLPAIGRVLVLLVVFTAACTTMRETTDTKDLSYLYNPLRNSINPRIGIYNEAPGTSMLNIKFFNTDLYFNEANPRGLPMAQVLISVRLFNLSLNRAMTDTARFDLEIIKDPASDEYNYSIPLEVEKGSEYIVEVKVYDKIREYMVQSFVPFNTRSDFNRYNFYARNHSRKTIMLFPVVRKDEFFNVLYNKGVPDSMYISYFRPSEDIPYPPSMMLPERPFSYEADTTVALAWSDTIPLMLPNTGIYQVSVSRESKEGITFFNFGKSYPNINTPEELIGPLAYLATSEELEKLKTTPWPKVGVDDFWLKIGRNVEKSRELIRIFYTRVMYANFYFTSAKEGWRTDRGMIYIMYGPPDKIYKSPGEENWGYIKPRTKSKWDSRFTPKEEYLFFTFRKRENLFTDNDYTLSRSETVVSYWDQAVAAWRKGIVFRLDNPEDI